MHIFVTGATGFVGTGVCQALTDQDHEVVGLTSQKDKARLLEQRGIRPVVGDMRDADVLAPQAEQADVTIMCAQLSLEGRFNKKRMLQFADAELRSVKAVVQGASKNKRRVIYTAGYLIFGVNRDGWSEEACGFDPPEFSRGGVVASEYLLKHVADGAVTGCVFAPGFVYGPAGFFANVTRLIKAGKFPLPGGGKYYWSPVYIEDLAAAYVAALDGKADGKALLVVDDEPMLMRDIMFAIADGLGAKHPGAVPTFMAKLFMGGAMIDGVTTSRRCRNDLAKQVLGWEPRFSTFRQGLPTVLEQLRAS